MPTKRKAAGNKRKRPIVPTPPQKQQLGSSRKDAISKRAVMQKGNSRARQTNRNAVAQSLAIPAVSGWDKESGRQTKRAAVPVLPLSEGSTKVLEAAALPFPVDSTDHCETPLVAYQHICFVLHAIASGLGKQPEELNIYDPFYCAGTVVANLAQCGFPNVYNKCEDFYGVQKYGKVPNFDVVVTNPPYSGDHVLQAFTFCRAAAKPYLLLLPNFFATKPWHAEFSASAFYVAPQKRYTYSAPKSRRDASQMRVDRKMSPFTSFWFCNLAGMEAERARLFEDVGAVPVSCRLVQGVRQLKRLGLIGSPWAQKMQR
mmetsp:Transcript_3862/g.10939  ORF Transcript_3862/g.10939 Transcript_3862/m.10939 type:complete len:315 (-) Transcript_3862:1185-2129(-)